MAPCNVPQLPLKDLRNAQEPPATCNLDLSNRERNSGADSVLPDAEKTTPPCTGCHADVLAPESPTEDMGDCNAEAALSGSVTDWIPSDFDPTPGPGPRRLVRPGGAPTAHRLVILLVALCGAMALIGRACTILGRTGDAHRAGTRPSPPPPAPPPDSPTSPTPSLPHKEGQQWTVSARAIGSGGYATVYQAHDRLTGEIVAVKKMPVPGVENDAEFREVEKEARLLAGLRHDNTVSYLGRFTEGRVLHLVMEYVPWGSLDALVQTYKYIPMPALRRYATDILRGLDYLHRHLFIHRDIKPANILVGQHGCKLSDFGLSCAQPHHVDPQGKAARTGPKGTPAYMSLEAIEGYPCTKSDVWAYGLTLLEVASGERPWGWLCVSRPIQLLAKVGQELRAKAEYELPAWLPVGFAAFLRRCLRTRSDERSAAGPLLGDEWLVTFDREEASVVPPKFRGLSARSSAYSTTSEYTETGTEDSSGL